MEVISSYFKELIFLKKSLLLFCRGDAKSVQMLFDCFREFSRSSGLIANKDKSSIYYGGTVMTEKKIILNILGFTEKVFVLSSKVVKLIEATCTTFLWTRGEELNKKALMARDKICYRG